MITQIKRAYVRDLNFNHFTSSNDQSLPRLTLYVLYVLVVTCIMAFDFTGKKILVTGAGRGIGRALALELAAAGAEVYALSRTKETLDTLSAESDRIHPIVADLSDWDKTRELVDKLEVLDGVVNNAAYLLSYFKDGLDYPKDELERSFQVNILGTINIIQSTGKKMVAAGKSGSIVNISR